MTGMTAGTGRRYDVFLSYHGGDRVVVERIADSLREQGIVAFFDRWCLTPGKQYYEELPECMAASAACAVFVGPQGLGDWVREELAVAIDRAAKDKTFKLFPVLLPGAPDPLDPKLALLATRTWVDLRASEADADDTSQKVAAALRGLPPPSASGGHPERDICPYRGLEPFDEEHAHLFFGREDDTLRVLERLKSSRFVAVVGPSGSGKSSLVRAGVVPALRSGALPASGSWSLRRFTPTARPLTVLGAQLSQLFGGESMQRTLEGLRNDGRTLDLAASAGLADAPPERRVALVVDQFEEVFTLCGDEAERAAFVANLAYAATIPAGRVVVILAMRADFYHRAAAHPALAALLGTQQYLVSPLGPEDLRQVVEAPAWRVGLTLEDGLVETILADVAGRPGTLPLLEHVLFEVWQRRRGRQLTLEAYVASGGVDGALADRANAIYAGFTPAQQAIGRRVLLRLTQPGEGTEDTRRRAAMSELVILADEAADLEAVVNTLCDQRLLTASRDEVTGERVLDITHEALIRGWPELRAWIGEDREALRLQRRLTEAAAEWDRAGRDTDLLYRGARLAPWAERDAADLNEAERAFLDASRSQVEAQRQRARRRTQVAVAGLSAAVLAVSSVAALFLSQRNQARDQRQVALSRQLAASARLQLEVDPERGLRLALDAYRARPTPEAEAVLRQAVVDSRVRATLADHDGPVKAAAFSPDGSLVASAGSDGTVRVRAWAGADGPAGTDGPAGAERPGVLRGHEGAVQTVAWSPDGRTVASAGTDGTVRLWAWPSTGAPARVLGRHEGPVNSVAFEPDGTALASAGADGTVRLWELRAEAGSRTLGSHDGRVWSVGWSPDGALVISGGQDGSARLWEAATGRVLKELKAGVALYDAQLSPDGRRLAGAGQDSVVRIWAWESDDAPIELRGGAAVSTVAWNRSGDRVASSDLGGRVRTWDLVRRQVTFELLGHRGAVNSVRYGGPDGELVSAGEDGTVRAWDANRGLIKEAGGLGVALSPDGRLLAVSQSGQVVVRDTAASSERRVVLDASGAFLTGVAFSADGSRVAAGGGDGRVRVWEWERSGPPLVLEGHEGAVRAVAFDPAGGPLLASAGDDGTVRVWRWAERAEPVVLRGHEGSVSDVAFAPDGRHLATAGYDDHTVRVWDPMAPGTAPVLLEGHESEVNSVAFGADGRWVASAGNEGTVRVWEWDGTSPPVTLEGHYGRVGAVAFNADGLLVVSGGRDGTVRVWRWQSPASAVSLQRRGSEVYEVAFHPDGSTVATADDEFAILRPCPVCGPMPEVVALAEGRTAPSGSNDASARVRADRPRPTPAEPAGR